MAKIATILIALLTLPAVAGAEWTVKPFAGISFGGSHGFVDLDGTSRRPKPVFGGAIGWRASSLGIELEFASDPKRLKGSSGLVETGRVNSVMANVMWMLPRPAARLRSYVTGGFGAVHVAYKDALNAFTSSSTLAAANVGGGVLIPVMRRTQLVVDIRYLRTRYGDASGAGFGDEYLVFWRASGGMLFAF